jgi:integrase
MVLVAFRHGLRAAELVDLRVDFQSGVLHTRRAKQGTPSTHPIDELRVLRRLLREQDPKSNFVFTSERGAPFTTGRIRPHGRARRHRRQAWLQGGPASL